MATLGRQSSSAAVRRWVTQPQTQQQAMVVGRHYSRSPLVGLGRQCRSLGQNSIAPCRRMAWTVLPSRVNNTSILPSLQFTKSSLSYYSTSIKSLQSDTPTSATTTTNTATAASTSSQSDNDEHENDNNDGAIQVYESPFGSLVTRLRSISLLTAVAGSAGLPIVIALKGTGMPTGGFLALCLSFGTGTLASTAAIHYVFGPYVFYIDKIPVRQCHYKPDTTTTKASTSTTQSYLYKATTKSIFLTRIETVFDPTTDEVQAYKGFTKPLCNLVVREQTYLFVHKESIYDNELYTKLPLNNDSDKDNDNDGNENSGGAKKSSFEKKAVTEETRRERQADKDDERFLF